MLNRSRSLNAQMAITISGKIDEGSWYWNCAICCLSLKSFCTTFTVRTCACTYALKCLLCCLLRIYPLKLHPPLFPLSSHRIIAPPLSSLLLLTTTTYPTPPPTLSHLQLMLHQIPHLTQDLRLECTNRTTDKNRLRADVDGKSLI